MDRATLNIVSALRLALVGGLFAVFWIIFGAGSAHAAAPPPPGERPTTSGGLVSSLTAPVKPLITTVQPRTAPAQPSAEAHAPVPRPATTNQLLGGTAPAPLPVQPATAPLNAAPAIAPAMAPGTATVLPEVAAPVTVLAGSVAPLAPPVTGLVAGTVQPILAPITGLAGSAVAPLTTPVTGLVAGTVQPILAPVTGIAGSVLSPVATMVESVTGPVTGLLTGTTPAPAGTGPANGIPGGADRTTTPLGSGLPVRHSANTVVSTRFPQLMGMTDGFAPRAVSMNDGSTFPQGPSGLPLGHEPAAALLLSPVSGGTASGPCPAGAGAQAVADFYYRFVLPMTGGGEGSLFSFVLPGPTTRGPGFSPD